MTKKTKDVNAFIEVFESAEEDAKKAQVMINNKNTSFLTGIPVAIKDNMCMKDKSITAGSKILEGFVSPYDSEVVSKLKKAGAVIVGRTNMDEFASGSSTEISAYGPTSNPV